MNVDVRLDRETLKRVIVENVDRIWGRLTMGLVQVVMTIETESGEMAIWMTRGQVEQITAALAEFLGAERKSA